MADMTIVDLNLAKYPQGSFATVLASALPAGSAVYQKITSTGCDGAITTSRSAAARACGILIHGGAAGDTAIVQTGDILTLSTAEWDQIAGTSGGLVRGDVYYVSGATYPPGPTGTAGALTSTKPANVCIVGIALSAKELLVNIEAFGVL